MYWIIFIICAIILKIIYDRYIHLQQINSNGGLTTRYKTLIDHLMARSKGQPSKVSKDQINIDYYGIGVSVHFCIMPIFDDVVIFWEFKSKLFDTLSHKWEFNETKISQLQMIEIIDRDINAQSKPFTDKLDSWDNENSNNELTNFDAKNDSGKEVKNAVTKDDVINILKSRKLIKEPGNYQIKVSGISNIQNLDDQRGLMVNIVEFEAMTPYLFSQAEAILKRLKEAGANDFQEAMNTNLRTLRRIGIDWIPKKGQLCNICVDYVATNDDPSDRALLVVDVTEIEVSNAVSESVTLESIDEEMLHPADQHLAISAKNLNPDTYGDVLNEPLCSVLEGYCRHMIDIVFLPLTTEKKSAVLCFFFQINHNNNFINGVIDSYNDVIDYDDYEDGFDFFKNFLIATPQNTSLIKTILEETISNPAEFFRFVQIVSWINCDYKNSDEFYGLAMAETLKKSRVNNIKTYGLNLLKTKLDLLVFSKQYFESADIVEKAWNFLEEQPNLTNRLWQKYQIAKTIIYLSMFVKINLDIPAIFESLEDLEISAVQEDLKIAYQNLNRSKSLANINMDKGYKILFEKNNLLTDVKVIINGFRKFASRNNLTLTEKTPDLEVLIIYKQVCERFLSASKIKNDIIEPHYFYNIVLHLLMIFEQFGIIIYNSHLDYEIEKYLDDGLRDDYKNDLKLFL